MDFLKWYKLIQLALVCFLTAKAEFVDFALVLAKKLKGCFL